MNELTKKNYKTKNSDLLAVLNVQEENKKTDLSFNDWAKLMQLAGLPISVVINELLSRCIDMLPSNEKNNQKK